MKLKQLFASALIVAASLLPGLARAGFDPVHQDIDIFMTNPSIQSERPNVLIIIDTSANWGQYFQIEKNALKAVVNSLSDQYNVGLAVGAGGNIQGSYIRYAVRQMTPSNKSVLSTMVEALTDGAFNNGGDKSDFPVPGNSMVEAYRYFKGAPSWSATTSNAGHDPRTDYNGNTANSYITNLAGNAFGGTPTLASTYNSPVVDGCQKNFVIYISNGKPSNANPEATDAKNELSTAKGSTATAISPLSPTGNETENWFDEWAKYLASTGFTKSINGVNKTVTVNTYVVEVAPASDPPSQQFTATAKSAASNGKGKYYVVDALTGNPTAQLTAAFQAIFSEIQAVNSVFASTTLPVSVNVRGTNLNQVYIGMFRPDSNKAPRWFGNLKLYKLALAADDKTLQLVDAAGTASESTTTGFIISTARSFWTSDSSFWSYRTAEENGAGGQSDSPDGDLVEKGAAAQKLRTNYATDQSARKLYTCTTGSYGNCSPCTVSGSGSTKTCTGGSNGEGVQLSDTKFHTDNTDITAAELALGTKLVSPLTAKVTKTVTSLADRRNVSLSNTAGASFSITGVSNGATAKTLTALTPFDPTKTLALSGLTGLTSVVGPYGIQARTASGSSVTMTTSASGTDLCASSDTVVVTGNHASVNGTWTKTSSAAVTGGKFKVTFTVAGSGAPNTAGSFSCGTKSSTATATVTALPAGLAATSRVKISGAVPSDFNGDFPVLSVSGNTFTYSLAGGVLAGSATTLGTLQVYDTVSGTTYSAGSSTIRIRGTTSAAHGFVAGNTIAISGVTPSTYDGSSYSVSSSPAVTSTTFAYNLSGFTGTLADATAFGTVFSGSAATTAVTITTASAHGFADGTLVAINGLSMCFDNASTAISGASGSTFSYTTSTACAPLGSVPGGATVAGAIYSTTVTATLTSHGYVAGNGITIADGTTTAHNGSFTVLGGADAPTASTFKYTNGAVGGTGPSGQYTVRLNANPLVYANATAHGFSTGDSITIANGNPSGYNGAFTITSIDANNFSYPSVGGGLGANSGTSMTAAKNTTTARATSVNHGFSNSSSVVIAGATPSAFNGTFTITTIDADTFTYPLGSAQGDATGTIQAAGGSGASSEVTALINWVRGANNSKTTGGENSTAADTTCRASVHGDVLHSRPAVINFNRYGGDNDVYIFYGSNDGVFRGIKGGTATDSGDGTTLQPGDEAWGFVAKETFGDLARLRNNSPPIGADFKRPYFLDGPIGVYTLDGDGDGKLESSSDDKVLLYIGARRGGRYLYSLSVRNPTNPRYRWTIDSTTSGFSDLGQTWSQPTVVTGVTGYTNPVLVFGGGYDDAVEDLEPCTITGTTAATYSSGVYTAGTVTYNKGTTAYNTTGTGCTVTSGVSTTISRSMGRAIYIVDAITGEKVWSASYRGSGADLEVDGMDFAIPSDVTVVKNLTDSTKTNRAYVGDTGGNLWRIDFGDANKANWKVTKIASISDLTTKTPASTGYITGYRKLMAPPDVVAQATDGQGAFDAVLMGSGDREHPFDNTIVNRFYMFKDRGNDDNNNGHINDSNLTAFSGTGTGTTTFLKDTDGNLIGDTNTVLTRTVNPVITHTNPSSPTATSATDGHLYDATSNCAQQSCSGTTTAAELTKIKAADGWFFTLGTGEKTIGRAVILNSVVFFNTNQPSQTSDANCNANLGIARSYQVSVATAGAARENETTSEGRSTEHAGGGYLPDPVHVVVQVTDSQGNLVTKEGVISGTSVQTPTTGAIGARTRRFWYKEVD